jgi:hypothetical protein
MFNKPTSGGGTSTSRLTTDSKIEGSNPGERGHSSLTRVYGCSTIRIFHPLKVHLHAGLISH